jgi:hypothetical protein
MRHDGGARGDLGPVKEAAVREEDAEGVRAFDDEAIPLARFGPRMG